MNRAELIALAERVVAEAGPDRELDEEIRLCPYVRDPYPAEPAYTASLDAAMQLYVRVPERIPSDPRKAIAEALRQRAAETPKGEGL